MTKASFLVISVVSILGMLASTGCVERRIYLRSEPAGADVFIDGEFIGQTRAEDHEAGPLYANFVFYGTREYTIRKRGYDTQSGVVELEMPWYEYPPVDFFSEVLAPWRITDEHEIEVKLEKSKPADVEALYRKAREFRYNSNPADRYELAALWASKDIRPAGND
ncbi:hypothetical protein OAU50_07300 [Planctomycetota bacterium]|nr:hypothetical protein [Planctomycetota bacterium]